MHDPIHPPGVIQMNNKPIVKILKHVSDRPVAFEIGTVNTPRPGIERDEVKGYLETHTHIPCC